MTAATTHVHSRQCYDDPGPGHGSPQLICGLIAGIDPDPDPATARTCTRCYRPRPYTVNPCPHCGNPEFSIPAEVPGTRPKGRKRTDAEARPR